MGDHAPETPSRAQKGMPVTPMSVPSRALGTPGSRLPVRCKTTRVSMTPGSTSMQVLGESSRENVMHRQRFFETSGKDLNMLVDDLRHEKHALLNEQENLKTQIQLGKQRELKLKAQIDKISALNARYKDRAQTYNRIEARQGVLAREQDSLVAQLQHAQNEATHFAMQCIELTGELEEFKLGGADLSMRVYEHMRQYMQSITQVAAEWVAENDTQAMALRDAKWHLAECQRTISSQACLLHDQKECLHDTQEQIEALYVERKDLYAELDEAYKRIVELQGRNEETLVDAPNVYETDMYAELAQTSAWKACIAESDAFWFHCKYESSEVRREWLEKTLAHTQTMHSKVLSALASQRSARLSSCAENDTALAKAKKQAHALEAANQELTEQLAQVSWYKEAYDARTEQTKILKALLDLQAQEKPKHQTAQECDEGVNDDEDFARSMLDMRIELLHHEQQSLEAKRHALMRQAQELEKHIAAHPRFLPERHASDSALSKHVSVSLPTQVHRT